MTGLRKIQGWLGLALWLAACQTATPLPTAAVAQATFTPVILPTVTAKPAPSLPTAVPITPTLAPPQDLTIAVGEGVPLAASFYPPASAAPAPGVLLLHQVGGSRADWASTAHKLQARGLAVLALDLRGHGQSPQPVDWTRGPGDVRAAWDVLKARPEVDAAQCAIVGASIGANLALIVGANNADVVTVVALSPGLDYQGVKPEAVLGNFGDRPALLVASQDDVYAYDSVRQLANAAPKLETYYLAHAGHGLAMLSDPKLETLLMEWLALHLGALKG